jgi:hypothetical protein
MKSRSKLRGWLHGINNKREIKRTTILPRLDKGRMQKGQWRIREGYRWKMKLREWKMRLIGCKLKLIDWTIEIR